MLSIYDSVEVEDEASSIGIDAGEGHIVLFASDFRLPLTNAFIAHRIDGKMPCLRHTLGRLEG